MLYRKNEQEVFKRIKESCNQDLRIWNMVNLGFPLLTVFISVLAFAYSDKSSKENSYFEFVFGGVLPLIAVNVIVAAAFFLINFDKQKEKGYGLETTNTRLKLILFAFVSYLFSSFLFVTQTIYTPFANCKQRIFQVFFTCMAILIAVHVANKLFLLQEDMIEKSYDQTISDSVSKLKNAIK